MNTNDYRYGFNGKENDPEWGNQDYGMRIYDPRVARFLSADPLIVKEQKYAELTPYQFASNTPIAAIDLDGLESKVVIAGKADPKYVKQHGYYESHVRTFHRRALIASTTVNTSPAVQVSTGDQLIQVLKDVTSKNGSISGGVIFAHSGSMGIYLEDKEGFYQSRRSSHKQTAGYIKDLAEAVEKGEIKFADGAVFYFMSCNAAFGNDNLAKDFAKAGNVTTIAPNGVCGPINTNDDQCETGTFNSGLGQGVFRKFYPDGSEGESLKTVNPYNEFGASSDECINSEGSSTSSNSNSNNKCED